MKTILFVCLYVFMFGTAYAQDATPPSVRLADIVVTTTENSVEARWITSEPATSQFEYGIVAENLTSIVTASALPLISHVAAVFNITPDTRYFYRIKTTDAANNTSTTITLSFVTKTRFTSPVEVLPRILDIQTLARTENLLRLYWKTSKDSVSWATYGKDSKNLDKTTLRGSQYTSIHSVELTGLDTGITYYYQINAQDAGGKTTQSPITSFQTIQIPSQVKIETGGLERQVAELQKQITELLAAQKQAPLPVPSLLTPDAKKTATFRYTFTKPLYYGLRGDNDVKALQEALATLELYNGPKTGNFFGLTFAAVKKFQKTHGLSAVGRVGPQTRAKLNELFSK